MRDLVAILVVLILVVAALAMATTLHWYRRGYRKQRRMLTAEGHTILADVPVADGLAFFSETTEAFHWDGRGIPKSEIRSAQLLISGAPLSTVRSRRFPPPPADTATREPQPVERERWDVQIEVGDETVLVACGSIRQQVSQEMARIIYESIRQAIETSDQNDHHSSS